MHSGTLRHSGTVQENGQTPCQACLRPRAGRRPRRRPRRRRAPRSPPRCAPSTRAAREFQGSRGQLIITHGVLSFRQSGRHREGHRERHCKAPDSRHRPSQSLATRFIACTQCTSVPVHTRRILLPWLGHSFPDCALVVNWCTRQPSHSPAPSAYFCARHRKTPGSLFSGARTPPTLVELEGTFRTESLHFGSSTEKADAPAGRLWPSAHTQRSRAENYAVKTHRYLRGTWYEPDNRHRLFPRKSPRLPELCTRELCRKGDAVVWQTLPLRRRGAAARRC